MPPLQESSVGLLPDSTGKKARTLQVTTMIDGVATDVQMQVLAIADGAGNVIGDFADYRLQAAMLRELQLMRSVLERWLGPTEFDTPGHQDIPTLTS